MRIAILGPYIDKKESYGGVEIHLKNLIDHFKKISYLKLDVISISKSISKDLEIRDGNVTIHYVRSVKIPTTISGITIDAINIIRKVKKINPEIVHGQMVGAPYGLATLMLSKKYPTVLTVHSTMKHKITSSNLEKIHDFIWRLLEGPEVRKIPHLITVSNYLKSELEGRKAKNIHVIPNGIGSEWFQIPDKSIEGRLLFVGRITPVKGIEILLRGIKKIKDNYNLKLHIVGPVVDVYYFERLKKIINELQIQDYVEFRGKMQGHDLYNEYAQSCIFVLPSLDETFSIVLLEAMAVGKPVVATNVGNIPYLIEDGTNGFLFEKGDHVKLAEKIAYLLENKSLRERMSKANKEKASNFSWENTAKKTIELYQKILIKE